MVRGYINGSWGGGLPRSLAYKRGLSLVLRLYNLKYYFTCYHNYSEPPYLSGRSCWLMVHLQVSYICTIIVPDDGPHVGLKHVVVVDTNYINNRGDNCCV